MARTCSKCTTRLPAPARFCPRCGTAAPGDETRNLAFLAVMVSGFVLMVLFLVVGASVRQQVHAPARMEVPIQQQRLIAP